LFVYEALIARCKSGDSKAKVSQDNLFSMLPNIDYTGNCLTIYPEDELFEIFIKYIYYALKIVT